MKRITILLMMLALLVPSMALAKGKDDKAMNYDLVGAGTATQGMYLVEVSVHTKDKKLPDVELKRAAVHGVLFRGFSNPTARVSQKPLAGSAANEGQHADFYKEFFSESGSATGYASIVPGSRTVKKVGKEYVVSAKVTVNKEQLEKYLREMGMIRGLNSAF